MKKIINLIFFHPYSGTGGADRSIARLINNLNENKYNIHFISLSKPKIRRFIKKKIYYHRINSIRTIFALWKIRKKVKNIFDKNNKNIFISNQNFANVLTNFILYKTRYKKIFIERNSLDELNHSKNLSNFIKNNIVKFLMKFTYSSSDIVICISKKLSQEIKDYTNATVKTIYNPSLDNSIYKKNEKLRLNIPKNLIVNIARLEKQKDHITLIKAFKNLKDKKNFKLCIVGYGSEYNNLIYLIKKYKLKERIIIIKNIKNPNLILKKSKLFILSSIYEGLGNVLIEAGLNKVPIISSNCNHGPSEILQNGKYGELFDVGDDKKLTNKIQNFIYNPKDLKRKSLLFYKDLKKFNTINIINKYKYIFEKI